MYKIVKQLIQLIFISSLFITTTVLSATIPNISDSIPNTSHPTTPLGTTVKGSYTHPLWYTSAFSLLGEVGTRNLRVGGTLGYEITDAQRIKFSGEYLWQNITYPFFSGNVSRWMQQAAIGLAYQYDIPPLCTDCLAYFPQFNLDAYLSHAPSKGLSTMSGEFVNQGMLDDFTEIRRIAGSNAGGVSPGLSIHPWIGSRLSAYLNYDYVDYRKIYSSSEDAHGIGGTLSLHQDFLNNIDLDLAAAVRRPFTNYAARVSFLHVPYYGNWSIGVGGAYTVGKNTLPNTYDIGLNIDYSVEPCPPPIVRANYKNEVIMLPANNRMINWVADPAIYLPQVLAVVDNQVTITTRGPASMILSCLPALLVTPIPDQPLMGSTQGPDTRVIATAPFFTGTNLTFSVTHSTVFTFGDTEPEVTIDPNTGLLTITVFFLTQGTITITVTATNSCGTVSTTFLQPFSSD